MPKDLAASYRYRCPHGHTAITAAVTPEAKTKYYCNSCADRQNGPYHDPHYEHLIDAKTGEEV